MRRALRGAELVGAVDAFEGSPVYVVVEPITVRLRDAVRLTGLSRSRIYELIGLGDIEIVKVGTSTLVLVASLRSFIEARRAKQASS